MPLRPLDFKNNPFCRHLPKWDATLRRLVDDARRKQPGLTYDEFMLVIEPRYRELRRARRKPSALPPKA